MEEEKKEKGFVIKDRRLFDEAGEVRKEEENTVKAKPADTSSGEAPKQEAPKQEAPQEPEGTVSDGDAYVPEANFANFILSLSTTVMYHFGDFPDPVSKKAVRNLQAAKHTIDMIGMLKIKTEGNLDENEKNLLEGLLFELRMRYVKEANPQ